MRYLLLVALLVPGLVDSAEFREEALYEQAVARAKAEYDRKMDAERKKLVAALERYKSAAVRKGDLETAKVLDDKIRNLIGGSVEDVTGDWHGVSPGWESTVTLRKDGVLLRDGRQRGMWEFKDHKIIVNWSKHPQEILEKRSDGSFATKTNTVILRRK